MQGLHHVRRAFAWRVKGTWQYESQTGARVGPRFFFTYFSPSLQRKRMP